MLTGQRITIYPTALISNTSTLNILSSLDSSAAVQNTSSPVSRFVTSLVNTRSIAIPIPLLSATVSTSLNYSSPSSTSIISIQPSQVPVSSVLASTAVPNPSDGNSTSSNPLCTPQATQIVVNPSFEYGCDDSGSRFAPWTPTPGTGVSIGGVNVGKRDFRIASKTYNYPAYDGSYAV